jgi:hypothetical protein
VVRLLDNTLVQVAIIGALSLTVAIILFQVTGSLAEASGQTGVLGLSIKTSGGLAGFIIVYWLLARQFERLVEAQLGSRRLKVTLVFEGSPLPRHAPGLRVQYKVHYLEAQEEKVSPCASRWEAGGLTVDIPVDKHENPLTIMIQTDNEGSWETDSFYPLTPTVTVRRIV